ncbi:hypothetical protein [Rhodanobacter denitrificans]|uniref:Uncharacterized protein n=1 Tax=Rhodanobacter denitrificans TaxID=666685 RepID=M4NJJ7_9GAMM|nr:hypothetical protein [Rhodanobacter denitrificans]AGG90277.1 hypothetical protein R2APBS1_3207 [Rhodanobacter denitrificans]UJM85664.1 hypothetical protein LRJ86_12860 [Rhodanobacter denitrificans]
MNKAHLKSAAEKLERLANEALAAGYLDASGMASGRIADLIQLAKAEQLDSPVKVGAGFDRAFSETRLGERVALKGAWLKFVWYIEDHDSKPEIIADKARHPNGYEV